MRISPKNLAYIYKKGCYIVCSKWKSSLEYKRELYRMHIRCRNIESLLTSSQNISEQELVEMTKAVKCIIPTECVDLLATPLIQLNINFRTLRALRKYNISQLEDLLRFIKHNGFDFLRKIPNIGKKSSEQLLNKLKEKNIMEDKESSSLFRYLVWKNHLTRDHSLIVTIYNTFGKKYFYRINIPIFARLRMQVHRQIKDKGMT